MSIRLTTLGLLPTLAFLGQVPGQAPVYTFDGDAAGDQLGWSVSSVGDVNGDGVGDIVVGGPLDDTNGADAGMARVLSGADGSTLWTSYGDSAGDNFGWSVGAAGDVNGDGSQDVVVGAPLDDNNGDASGSARVLSGATGAILYTFDGDSAGDNFGWSVYGAGDTDGDGYDDVIAGAPLDDNNGDASGMARVLSGATGATLHTLDGDGAGDNFGWAVHGAGDTDGDCFDDVVVGAPLDDNNGNESGMVRVVSGSTGITLWSADGDSAADNFGWSVACAGDADGDGNADVVAGAPLDDNRGSESGMARILSGATGATVHTVDGDRPGDNLGWSVGGCGDVDGDGTPDVMTGSPLHDSGGDNAGRAAAWSGATGLRIWAVDGGADDDNLGWSVDIAGDTDSNGFAELLAGAPLADNGGAESGSALLWRRLPYDRLIPFTKLSPSGAGSLFGNDHQNVGDVNNDGFDDFGVGAVADMAAQGTVRIFSGADQSILHTFAGGLNNIFFGPSIAPAGDIDNDGHDDVLTGAQHYRVTQFEGRATIRNGATGAIMQQWFGIQPNAHMGSALGGLGDINNDGTGDVYVGLLKENTAGPSAGEVRAYDGATGGILYQVAGLARGEWFSSRGATVGDLDDDGILDFVIGAPQPATVPNSLQGYAVVLSGVNGSQIWRFNGLAFGDLFGWAVGAAGDVDSDGYGDIIVGAQGHDPSGMQNAGMARVFSGKTGLMLYEYFGAAAGDGMGESVNGAGDVNGDGFDDFVIGIPGADPGGRIAAGSALVMSGQDGSLLRELVGPAFLGVFGKACSGIGDVNGDGFGDVSIGATEDPTAGPQAGAIHLFHSVTKADRGSFEIYGAACPGSNGKLPKIGFSGRPVLAQAIDISVQGGPATELASLGFDVQKQNVPLAFLNGRTCTFWALPFLAINTATDASGKANINLTVPNDPAMVGATLYAQWTLRDLGVVGLPFVFSDAGCINFGNP